MVGRLTCGVAQSDRVCTPIFQTGTWLEEGAGGAFAKFDRYDSLFVRIYIGFL